MPDFIRRFGEQDANGVFFLSNSRSSIITSLLSAGLVLSAFFHARALMECTLPQNLRVSSTWFSLSALDVLMLGFCHRQWCLGSGIHIRSLRSPWFNSHLVRNIHRWCRHPDWNYVLHCANHLWEVRCWAWCRRPIW